MSQSSQLNLAITERDLLEQSESIEVDWYLKVVHLRGYREIRETTKLETT